MLFLVSQNTQNIKPLKLCSPGDNTFLSSFISLITRIGKAWHDYIVTKLIVNTLNLQLYTVEVIPATGTI